MESFEIVDYNVVITGRGVGINLWGEDASKTLMILFDESSGSCRQISFSVSDSYSDLLLKEPITKLPYYLELLRTKSPAHVTYSNEGDSGSISIGFGPHTPDDGREWPDEDTEEKS